MPSFKVLISKDSNNVVLNGNFENYNSYDEIKAKIIEYSQKSVFMQDNLNIKQNEKFKLVFTKKDNQKDIFFPEDLPNYSIWDNTTYDYLKRKLILKGIKKIKYRFYIERINEYPKFEKKKNSEILNEALDKFWELAYTDITSELTLTKLEKRNNEFNKLKEEEEKINLENNNKEKHINIICSNCFKNNILGKRFICSECNNYNLCQECEKLLNTMEIHQREHVFIQINKCLKQNTYFKYNNIIGNYNKEFRNISSNFFNLELTVVNNGENDLKNCYILPIRFGDEYLNCIPKTIAESIKQGMSTIINLNVIKPGKNRDNLKGYFRMFTPEGIPFGNVIFIKVLNKY